MGEGVPSPLLSWLDSRLDWATKFFRPHRIMPCFVVIAFTETKKNTQVDKKRRGGPRFFPASAMLFSSSRTSTEKLTLSASRGGIGKKSRTLSKGRDLPETLSQAEKTRLFVNHESSFYWTVRSVELRRKFAHFVWGVGWYSEPPKHFCFFMIWFWNWCKS